MALGLDALCPGESRECIALAGCLALSGILVSPRMERKGAT